jgi:hypothetical protein
MFWVVCTKVHGWTNNGHCRSAQTQIYMAGPQDGTVFIKSFSRVDLDVRCAPDKSLVALAVQTSVFMPKKGNLCTNYMTFGVLFVLCKRLRWQH